MTLWTPSTLLFKYRCVSLSILGTLLSLALIHVNKIPGGTTVCQCVSISQSPHTPLCVWVWVGVIFHVFVHMPPSLYVCVCVCQISVGQVDAKRQIKAVQRSRESD